MEIQPHPTSTLVEHPENLLNPTKATDHAALTVSSYFVVEMWPSRLEFEQKGPSSHSTFKISIIVYHRTPAIEI